MKKNIFIALVLLLTSHCLHGKSYQQTSQRSDMLRKTYLNFAMGYTLRYFENDWLLDREKSAYNVFLTSKLNPGITINIWSDDAEKHLSRKEMEEKFRDSVSGFAQCQIDEVKEIKINGLDFLFYDAVITPFDASKRMLTYMYTGKEGTLIFVVKTPVELSKESADKIASLMQGFSFDGKACCGNRALRGAKSFLEFFTD